MSCTVTVAQIEVRYCYLSENLMFAVSIDGYNCGALVVPDREKGYALLEALEGAGAICVRHVGELRDEPSSLNE